MKRFGVIALALVAMTLAVPCFAKKAVKREAGKTYELVLLHTNDQHGTVLDKSGKGGLPSQATFVKQVRAENKNVLLISAGDINTGSALSNMFAAEPDIKAYGKIGYDAVTLGNHEFDTTMAKLLTQIKIADFPWISANVKKGKKTLVKPYIVKDYEGFRVGVFGLTTRRTLTIASPDKSLTFDDEIETAKKMVKQLREKEKCDLVILSGHIGDIEEVEGHETSLMIAEKVPGIDVIVDGHSHSLFTEPKLVNGVPIVTANEHGKIVGEAKIKIADGKLTEFDWKPVEITTEAFPPDAEMMAFLKPYIDKANASLKEVVLKTTGEFEFGKKLTRYQEMASGDVLCDGMVWYLNSIGVKPDFAVFNGGSIRTSLPKGDVTRENILTMLPFENYVYTVDLKGEDVVKLFDFIGSIRQGAGGWAQVSKEVKYTITYDAEGNGKISDVTINGKEIDPSKTYKVACNDYMAGGGDGYPLKVGTGVFNSSQLVSEVFINYVKTLGTVTPTVDNRITVVGGKLPD